MVLVAKQQLGNELAHGLTCFAPCTNSQAFLLEECREEKGLSDD